MKSLLDTRPSSTSATKPYAGMCSVLSGLMLRKDWRPAGQEELETGVGRCDPGCGQSDRDEIAIDGKGYLFRSDAKGATGKVFSLRRRAPAHIRKCENSHHPPSPEPEGNPCH